MKTWKLPLAALTLAVVSVGALNAQDGPPPLPGQMDPSRVVAGTYKTDKNHSLIGFRYNHLGFNDYFGMFGDVDATLHIDPANMSAAHVEATIPINPMVTSPDFHDHLLRPGEDGKAPDFFGPDPAPARFVSTSVAVDGASATIDGQLTLNGITKPVTIDARFTGAGNSMMGNKLTVGFEGSAKINRSDFGLGTFVPMVEDEVTLDITVAFEKE